jgi:hypothetical protein
MQQETKVSLNGLPLLLRCPGKPSGWALAAAQVTGPGTVYRILGALGNYVGPVQGQKKRKGLT